MKIDQQVIDTLLASTTNLEAYLADVGARRERTRVTRRRSYWLHALPRLNVELIGAREEDDAEIAAELEQVVGAFEAALAAFPGPAPPDNNADFCSSTQLRQDAPQHSNQFSCDIADYDSKEQMGQSEAPNGNGGAGVPSPKEVSEAGGVSSRRVTRESAVQSIVQWWKGLVRLGRTIVIDQDDCDLLYLFLDDCEEAGVPPTNAAIQAALVDAAPSIMKGQLTHHPFLMSVLAERRKIGASSAVPDTQRPEAACADDLELMRQNVANFTRGRRAIILGGKRRPRVQQELQNLLECEVEWVDSEPTSQASKFVSKIDNADIVLMVKNFARHELFHVGKEAMDRRGGHFIVLPSGYGVRQVVDQINNYLGRTKPE